MGFSSFAFVGFGFFATAAWVGFLFDIQVFRTYGHIRGKGEGGVWVDSRFGFEYAACGLKRFKL